MCCKKANLQCCKSEVASTRLLTNVIVSSVHGVLFQAVPHDVPAHEGVWRALNVLLIIILLWVHSSLWQAAQVHVAWLVFCRLQNGENVSYIFLIKSRSLEFGVPIQWWVFCKCWDHNTIVNVQQHKLYTESSVFSSTRTSFKTSPAQNNFCNKHILIQWSITENTDPRIPLKTLVTV